MASCHGERTAARWLTFLSGLGYSLDRERLFASFADLTIQLQKQYIRGALFVGGSYVTRKYKPGDLDVAIDLRKVPPSAPGIRIAFRLSSDFRARGLDLLPVVSGGDDYIELLCRLRPFDCLLLGLPPNYRKGVLQVS